MRISYLFVVSMLSSLPVVAFSAQPRDPSQSAPATTAGAQSISTATLLAFSSDDSGKPLDDTRMRELLEKANKAVNEAMVKDDTRCYAIESYRFTQENPDSDATRLTERSSCQPAAQFHLKRVTPPPAKSSAH
jgi:hypothetical protein